MASEQPLLAAPWAEVEVVKLGGGERCFALTLIVRLCMWWEEEAEAERSAEVRVSELQRALVGDDCEPQRSAALVCAEDTRAIAV